MPVNHVCLIPSWKTLSYRAEFLDSPDPTQHWISVSTENDLLPFVTDLNNFYGQNLSGDVVCWPLPLIRLSRVGEGHVHAHICTRKTASAARANCKKGFLPMLALTLNIHCCTLISIKYNSSHEMVVTVCFILDSLSASACNIFYWDLRLIWRGLN